MRPSGSKSSLVDREESAHVCWLFDETRQWKARAVFFFEGGAHEEDRLIYVTDRSPSDQACDLAMLGSREELLASGQLTLRPLADMFAPLTSGSIEEQVDRWRDEVDLATGNGYRGLRVATEGTALLSSEGSMEVRAYELLLDRLTSTTSLSMLCGFDRQVGRRATAMLSFAHRSSNAGGLDHLAWLSAVGDGRWRLEGELDAGNAGQLAAGLACLAEHEPADLHLDLGGLKFIDAAGAGALVAAGAGLHPSRRLVLCDASETLTWILEIGWGVTPGLHVALREGLE